MYFKRLLEDIFEEGHKCLEAVLQALQAGCAFEGKLLL